MKNEKQYFCEKCEKQFKGFLRREPIGCPYCHRSDWRKVPEGRNPNYYVYGQNRRHNQDIEIEEENKKLAWLGDLFENHPNKLLYQTLYIEYDMDFREGK